MAVGSASGVNGYMSASGKVRKGIGGLASGLDTDELVKGMTGNTRAKIARQLQMKQKLSWKTDAYRSVSTKLISFSDKYLSYSSKTNLFSESFFDNNKTIGAKGDNSKYINVSGNSSVYGNLSIQSVDQLAQNESILTSGNTSTNKLSSGEINLGEREVNSLAGKNLEITYGGKDYKITIDKNFNGKTADDAIQAINDALGKVTVDGSTDTLADKMEFKKSTSKTQDGEIITNFTFQTKTAGEQAKIKGGDSLALKVLGVKAGATSGTEDVGTIMDSNIVIEVDFLKSMKDKNMNFEYNGTKKTFSFSEEELGKLTDMDSFKNLMQSKLDKEFGKNRIQVDVTNGNTKSGELSFTTRKNNGADLDTTSTFKFATGDSGVTGEYGALNMQSGSSNRINTNLKLSDSNLMNTLTPTADGKYEMTINGEKFSFTGDQTLQDIIYEINSNTNAEVKITYLETSDRFSIESTKSGADGNIEIKDENGSNLAESLFKMSDFGTNPPTNGAVKTEGKDAQITISYGNGSNIVLTRNTNSFNIDGLNITVNGTFTAATGGAVTFEGKSNPDEIVDAVKNMIDDYNALMDIINKEGSTKPDRKYPPLTDEQKADMSDKEIEAWEEKAKAGVLFGDGDIRSLASEMRFALTFGLNGKGDLTSIGLTSGSSYKDNGKITFDEKKFKAALEDDPEGIKNLFTKVPDKIIDPATGEPKKDPVSGKELTDTMSGGLMSRMKGIYEKYATTVGSEKGIFIKKAGLKDSLTNLNSTIYKEMEDIDLEVTNLKRKLAIEEDRYYRQFTRLEQVVAQMNSQGEWFAQQMG